MKTLPEFLTWLKDKVPEGQDIVRNLNLKIRLGHAGPEDVDWKPWHFSSEGCVQLAFNRKSKLNEPVILSVNLSWAEYGFPWTDLYFREDPELGSVVMLLVEDYYCEIAVDWKP